MIERKNDEFLTQREAAELIRCSQVSIWRLRKRGQLAFHRILGKILIRRSDIENLLVRQRRNGQEER